MVVLAEWHSLEKWDNLQEEEEHWRPRRKEKEGENREEK